MEMNETESRPRNEKWFWDIRLVVRFQAKLNTLDAILAYDRSDDLYDHIQLFERQMDLSYLPPKPLNYIRTALW